MLMKFMLWARTARRVGAFKRAMAKGMTQAEARAHADALYPPTDDDLAYEAQLREKAKRSA